MIDFGPEIGRKKSSAQITVRHSLDELVGRQVMAVVNFPPAPDRADALGVLTLGFPDEAGNVVLAALAHPVPNGGRLF